MGALPTPPDWARDLWTKFGGRFESIEARLKKLETDRSFVFAPVQMDLNSTNLPTSFAVVLNQAFPVPGGYSQAIVAVTATAGVSFTGASGNGNVGVAPSIAGSFSPGTSSGIPGAGSVTAPCTQAVQVTELGSTLTILAQAYSSAGGSVSVVANSGNVHVTGFIIYLR